MSELRDVRLLIAQRLDATRDVKAAIIDVMNILDAELDINGFEAGDDLRNAMRRLERAIINDDGAPVQDEDDDFINDEEEEDEDDEEFIDIADVEMMAQDDEDDEEDDD